MVRVLGVEDVEAYVALRREMLLDTPWAFGASPGDDRGGEAEGLRASLGREGFAIVGAFEGSVLVGAAGVVREGKAKRRHIAVVWGVYVTPLTRGRGFARGLMTAAVEAARGWGVEVVHLSVSERGAGARRLYESLGFEAWGVEPDALRVDGASYAEVHMLKRLNAGVTPLPPADR